MLFSVQLVGAFGFMFFSFIHETLDFLLESFADTTSTPKKKKKKKKKPSRWWSSGKNLGPRGLLSLWSQVRALWLLI
jgi:hypothetical protein